MVTTAVPPVVEHKEQQEPKEQKKEKVMGFRPNSNYAILIQEGSKDFIEVKENKILF